MSVAQNNTPHFEKDFFMLISFVSLTMSQPLVDRVDYWHHVPAREVGKPAHKQVY